MPLKDLEMASKSLVTALMIREKYMAMSQQSFPQITARFLQSLEDREEFQGMTEGLNLADKKAMSGNYCCSSQRNLRKREKNLYLKFS